MFACLLRQRSIFPRDADINKPSCPKSQKTKFSSVCQSTEICPIHRQNDQMRFVTYCVHVPKCSLPDSKCKRSPNQTALNKVLRFKGTPCDTFLCMYKVAGISLCSCMNLRRSMSCAFKNEETNSEGKNKVGHYKVVSLLAHLLLSKSLLHRSQHLFDLPFSHECCTLLRL